MYRPHRNPFRQWASGFATEIAVFAGVIIVLSMLGVLAGMLAG